MQAARSLGISYKRWNGWEPTPGDAVEWDGVERSWMLALNIYERSHVCPVCGMDMAFCHDQAAVERAFTGAGVETCFVGQMRERAMADFTKSGTVEAPNSQTTSLHARPAGNQTKTGGAAWR